MFEVNTSIDFSSNGMSFETPKAYSKGNLVLLELPLEGLGSGKRIKVLVSVAWCRRADDQKYRVGAEIVAIDPTEKKILHAHLSKLKPKATAKRKTKRKSKVTKKPKKKSKRGKKS